MTMRDILADLKERHAAVIGRIVDEHDRYVRAQDALDAQHKLETEALERERKALETLLSIEQARDGVVPVQGPPPRPLLSLGEFLTTKVHAHGPMDKEELRLEAETAGYFNDDTNGRTFHTTLLNAEKHGKIIKLPDGKYAYPVRQIGSLFDTQGTKAAN